MTTDPTVSRPEVDDPRVLALAQARQQLAYENPFNAVCPPWDGLSEQEQHLSLLDARSYLHAALRAGLAPAAVSVPPPAPRADDQAALRDRIAEVLADADGWRWAEGFKEQSPTWQGYQERADAVLAVLPEPADAPAAECSAQNRNYESGPRLCIRAAQHHGDHIDDRGFHWSDTVAVYPVSDGTFRRGADVRAALRRLAAVSGPCVAGEQQNETPEAEACGPAPDACDAEAGEPCANHEREQAHAEGEHAFCGPECGEAEPTAEDIARANVLALHQIGEQLAGIESWMWEHLANVREAAKTESAAGAQQGGAAS